MCFSFEFSSDLTRLNSLKRKQGSVIANMLGGGASAGGGGSGETRSKPGSAGARPTPPGPRGSSKLRSRFVNLPLKKA